MFNLVMFRGMLRYQAQLLECAPMAAWGNIFAWINVVGNLCLSIHIVL